VRLYNILWINVMFLFLDCTSELIKKECRFLNLIPKLLEKYFRKIAHRCQDIKRENRDLVKGVSLVRLYVSPICLIASACVG